jgi:glycosyltransferase involved in cell wall biosynthesis
VTELETIHASRAWRAVTRYRLARHAIGRGVRQPTRAVRGLAARVVRRVVPAPQRQALRRAASRLLMNPYAYAFDRYKRQRQATYGAHLDGITAPGVPGLVSVVLPVYNGAAMLGGAIDSVLAQRYASLELIVVDDGSTDESGKIADDYARRDARVRVVHQENLKLPAALTRGFREARGEFLTWTSADNRLKADCLERLVACLRRHPRWDMVYANIDLIDEDGAPLRHSPHYEGYQHPRGSEHVRLPASTAELNVWPNNFVGAAFLYRSRVRYLAGDYSPHRFVLEDYEYWMRVNALMTLRHADFDEPVYDYRFHRGSLTSDWKTHDMWRRRDRMMVFDEFRRDFYLTPLVWVLDGDDAGLDALRREIVRAGHLVYDGRYPLHDVPRSFVPVVYVNWSRQPAPEHARRPDLPERAVRVLVANERDLSAAVAPEWDLAVAVGAGGPHPMLERPGQGWLGVEDALRLFRAVDIRVRVAHTAEIEGLAESPAAPTLRATVVICTHRDTDRVARAVKAVLGQSVPGNEFELLVVDNAPSRPDVRRAVARLREDGVPVDRVRVVACPIPGLSAARNAGLAEARGAIVAFLDDDAVAEPEWLSRLCAAYDAHPEAAVIGGHIALRIPEPRPTALRPGWEKYWSQYVTAHDRYTEVRHWWEFPWGANWSARRDALLRIGGFRTRYGRVGDNFWGGEELVAAALMQSLGGRIAVLPGASVAHDVDAARFSFEHVRRTMLSGHLASYQAQRDLYVPNEGGLTTTLGMLVGRHFDRDVPLRYRARDAWFRKVAQWRLLTAQLRDLWQRRRSAAVTTDGP